jgi:WD40 repeat protein
MNPVKIYDMEFMPDHNTFLVTTDFELQIRSTETGEILETYPYGSRELEFTPDSTRLISYNRDTLFIRNLEDFSLIKSYVLPEGDEHSVHSFRDLVVDPIRPYIYVIHEIYSTYPEYLHCYVLIFNYETMELVKDITPEGLEKRYSKILAISNDGKYLVDVTSVNSKLVVWDLDTREVYRELQLCPYMEVFDGYPTCVKFSKLDNDKIYISGMFSQGLGSHRYIGLIIYSIIENKIIDSAYSEGENRIGPGIFTLFDNENRIIFTNGMIMYIINLENMELELTSGVFYIGKQIIYLEKKDVFLGRSDFNISRLGYDRNTEVENDIEQTDIIYPNPTKGKIYINLEDILEFTWQLFNFEGKLLIESKELNQKEIDLTNYPNGIYLLHLHYDGQEETIKIVKEG